MTVGRCCLQDNYAGVKEVPVCNRRRRSPVQHLYTSTGNEVTLYVSRGRMGDHRSAFDMDNYPRLIISYEGAHQSLYALPNRERATYWRVYCFCQVLQ